MPKKRTDSGLKKNAKQKKITSEGISLTQPPIPWDWLDHLREIIILADAKSLRIIKTNLICGQILGYSPEEFNELTLESLIDYRSPAVQEKFLEAVHQEESIPKTLSLDLYDKDGDPLRARVTISNMSMEPEGGILLTALLVPDNLEDPERLHSLYRKLIECGDGVPYHRIYNCDDFLYMSPKCQDLLGVSPNELTLSGLREMVIEQNIAIPVSQESGSEETQEKRRLYKSEIRVITPKGEDKWIQDLSVLYFDRDGERIQGTLGILLDITHQKKLEMEAQRVRIQLQAIASTAHILLQGHNWEQSLHNILGRIGRVMKAQRVYLFENFTNQEQGLSCRVRDEWKEEGISSFRNEPDFKSFSYSKPLMKECYEKLSRGNNYTVTLQELPASTQKELKKYNTQSLIYIPISVENLWWGFLELHNCQTARKWREDEIDFLNLMASLIGEALTRVISEEKFQWAHRIYTQAIETARGVPYQFDYDTEQYIFVGSNAEEVLGIPSSQLTYNNLNKYIKETVYFTETHRGTYKDAFKSKKAGQYNVDLKIINDDGEERWINDCAVPNIDPLTHKVIGTLGIFHDVTERYENLKKLREAEEQLSSLVNASPDIICIKDGKGRWLLANQKVLKQYNLQDANYAGKTDAELARCTRSHYDALINCEATDEQAWKNRGISRSQEIVPDSKGSSRIYDLLKVPLFDRDGSRNKLIVLGHDVTELINSRDESIRQKNLIQKITDTSPLLIYIYDRVNHKKVFINQAFTDILGYQQADIDTIKPEDILSRLFSQDSLPFWADNPAEYLAKLSTGNFCESEYCLKTKTGGKRWFLLREIMFEKTPEGIPAQILGFGLDITERKIVQDELKKLHQQYQDIISQSQGLVYKYDSKTQTYEFLGDSSEILPQLESSHLKRDKLLSLFNSQKVLLKEAPPSAAEYFEQFVAGKFAIYKVDNQIINPDSTERWLSDCSIAIKDPQTEKFIGALGIFQDVTERNINQKVLETLLKLSEQLLTSQTQEAVGKVLAQRSWDLFHHDAFSLDLYEEKKDAFRVIYSEDTPQGKDHPVEIGTGSIYAKEKMGKETMLGKQTLIHREENESNGSFSPFGFENRKSKSLLFIPVILKGKTVGVATIQSYSKNRFTQKDASLFQAMVDQTASALFRTMAEEARRDSELHYRLLAENSMDIISQISREKRFLYISPSIKTVLGYEPEKVVGTSIYDYLHPDDVSVIDQAIEKARATGQSITMQYRTLHKKGHFVWMESLVHILKDIDLIHPIEIQCSTREITQRKNLETQFIHSQKMELVGHFAGGIAHDFNNLLTSVIGNTELLLTMANDKDPFIKDSLKDILDSAQRGAELTRQLLMFARQKAPEYQLYSPKRMLDDSLLLLKQTLGKTIDIIVDMAEKDYLLMIDPVQIQQMILNIATNARDAMPDGGKLNIKTDYKCLTAEDCINRPLAREGHFFLLRMKDTGLGMSEEIKSHIFEPFFTTKDTGKGTGLGLSVVDGIIKSHHGWIEVESNINKGTEFIIYIPVAETDNI
jgi:PAS domain S-box-containing protein